MKKLLTLALLISLTSASFGQKEPPLTRILFIFDASNSMNGIWNKKPKIDVATRLLSAALDSLYGVENLQLGMRVYGHDKYYMKGQDCDDTKLLVPLGSNKTTQIKAELRKLKPKGTTPIAATLEKSADDFPRCPNGNCRNIIILITDGIEECSGDPCAVSMALQRRGIILKPFIIGIGLNVEFREHYECMGSFYDASDEERFKNVLDIVISQALNTTTAQVNLIDANGSPTETNINMTFYDRNNGETIHNYVHTMNVKGNPDTLALDPVHTYRVVAHTIPPRSNDSASITPGTHTIIGINTPQGDLEFKMPGSNRELNNLKVIVRKSGEMNTLNIQSFDETIRYITGKYDLEILTIPRTYISDVDISQSHTTTIQIPQPGVVTFSKLGYGYGSVYVVNKNEQELVANLSLTKERESLSLQPGEYVAVFRPKQARESIFTVEKRFTVSSGASVAVKLN
ncbi:MAG: VWA domain-containing protein [Flavobacteriales bacterium]|jgi:Ca-activated chloride channel family protein|nr:VWA domain-containing protein [Flavobacteriales bacterium]MBT3962933.1 VWA domain-containing protein [Flavobacteriales bacterium]MBT4704349.1 VWA domain-containing protein [Flavobacteriales bacterium]MBT4930495.1 VWA domain-containing protein [Flavobacteriales bacterium]MBT5131771.1 VWA domain-containing protein [Flavobacteriales bacterium]